MSETIFYRCNHCGNLVTKIHDSKVPIICCGEPMEGLVVGSVDASKEKHVPVVTRNGDTLTVQVGSTPHPMVEEHYIQWIFVRTENGGQLRYLKPGMEPSAVFDTGKDKPVAVYEYCNIHGLWKTDL